VNSVTLQYNSPERVNNNTFSLKEDVWALGVNLYYLTSFKMPFGDKNTPLCIIACNIML
jgi:serine/threonine protein kinase